MEEDYKNYSREESDRKLYTVTHELYTPFVKLQREIRKLQYNYDADFRTYTKLKDTKKLESLKKKFKEKHLFLTERSEEYDAQIQEYVKRKMLEDKSSTIHVSKLQLFMDTLKELEGENKKAVLHQTLVRELVDEKKAFSREQANEYIRRMIREASIYESRPGFYNRV